ncbi:fatty acyl-AMP ligase [Nocardia vermiculata]|nr:fatty acyl-AMP ligase [Nocardia vermiculata]
MMNPLAAAVADRAVLDPDAAACTALSYPAGRCTAATLTYAELHSATGDLAQALRERTAPGDRVAIFCEHGLDYVIAFLACLYSARTAVPLFPVSARRNSERLRAVLDDARPRLGLVSAGADIPDAQWLSMLDYLPVDVHGRCENVLLDRTGTAPAYLQYTSGSTTSPAGVDISHENLGAALDQLRGALTVATRRPMVNWLPYFHDMGLVFALSLPLYTGVHSVTLSAAEFAKRPIRWLRACSDYGAGITASPNFGLTLAVSATTATERDDLDLSALEVLLNGAEPIRPATLAAFTDAFAPHGFDHRAHTPGYGLAEATLPVTISAVDAAPVAVEFDRAALTRGRAAVAPSPSDGSCLVDCGLPVGQAVRIVDPARDIPLEDGSVGEIWVQGPNVAGGYSGQDERTAATFGALLAGTPGTWLRTGDLGFVHNGGLFIAGRMHDTIIIDGRNHFPADIEATAANSAAELRTEHIAAFGTDSGEREEVVIVAEVGSTTVDTTAVARRVRAAIADIHGITPRVLTVSRGTIPKTSSGKVRRGECRTHYHAGYFDPGGVGSRRGRNIG